MGMWTKAINKVSESESESESKDANLITVFENDPRENANVKALTGLLYALSPARPPARSGDDNTPKPFITAM